MPIPFIISCCSIALRDRPVAEAIDIIADGGFKGIELWYPHVEKLDAEGLQAVKEHCARRNLELVAISPYFSFTRGEEWRVRSLETGRRVLEIARAIGVQKIRTFVDIGPDGMSSAKATEADWKAAVGGLQELCDLSPKTPFVTETHINTLADTLPTVQRLLKEVNRPNFLLNFQDNPDFSKRGYMACLEALFPWVNHMHWQQPLSDGGETYIEEPGLIDFKALIGWLAAKGYTGTASVEYCWQPVDVKRIATAGKFLASI